MFGQTAIAGHVNYDLRICTVLECRQRARLLRSKYELLMFRVTRLLSWSAEYFAKHVLAYPQPSTPAQQEKKFYNIIRSSMFVLGYLTNLQKWMVCFIIDFEVAFTNFLQQQQPWNFYNLCLWAADLASSGVERKFRVYLASCWGQQPRTQCPRLQEEFSNFVVTSVWFAQ